MTIPVDPAKVARAMVRHVRNSHAIGKLVVDTALRGMAGKARGSASVSPDVPPSTVPGPSEVRDGDVSAPSDDALPLPVAQWALLSSGDVVDMIKRCDDDVVRAIGAYEQSHRRRRLVVQAVKNRLAE